MKNQLIKNNNIKPIFLGCLTDFPFLDNTFGSMTEWEILQKLGAKTNEIIDFINSVLDEKLDDYIDKKFNEIMINALYESETETLILYKEENNEN